MEVTHVLASVEDWGVGDRNSSVLVPFRLAIPGFLPINSDVAKRMVNDLSSGYCEGAWVVGEESHWSSKELASLVAGMDWKSIEILQYDWDADDGYGEKLHDPWQTWRDLGMNGRRVKDLEPYIEKENSLEYAKSLRPEEWHGWDSESLIKNPCWMFYYAKNVCKGRLPDVLDNAMTMLSFQDADDPWIKRYFGTKKYRRRNKKALSSIPWAA